MPHSMIRQGTSHQSATLYSCQSALTHSSLHSSGFTPFRPLTPLTPRPPSSRNLPSSSVPHRNSFRPLTQPDGLRKRLSAVQHRGRRRCCDASKVSVLSIIPRLRGDGDEAASASAWGSGGESFAIWPLIGAAKKWCVALWGTRPFVLREYVYVDALARLDVFFYVPGTASLDHMGFYGYRWITLEKLFPTIETYTSVAASPSHTLYYEEVTRRNELKLYPSPSTDCTPPPPPIAPHPLHRLHPTPSSVGCFAVLTKRNIFFDPLAIEWCNWVLNVDDRFGAAMPNLLRRLDSTVLSTLEHLPQEVAIVLLQARLNFTEPYKLGSESFLHWLLHICEVTPFLTALCVAELHNCNVFIHWRRVTQDESNKVLSNDKRIAETHNRTFSIVLCRKVHRHAFEKLELHVRISLHYKTRKMKLHVARRVPVSMIENTLHLKDMCGRNCTHGITGRRFEFLVRIVICQSFYTSRLYVDNADVNKDAVHSLNTSTASIKKFTGECSGIDTRAGEGRNSPLRRGEVVVDGVVPHLVVVEVQEASTTSFVFLAQLEQPRVRQLLHAGRARCRVIQGRPPSIAHSGGGRRRLSHRGGPRLAYIPPATWPRVPAHRTAPTARVSPPCLQPLTPAALLHNTPPISTSEYENGAVGKTEDPRKPADQRPSSGMIQTCKNTGETRPGIHPGPRWWEASSLTAQPPRPRQKKRCKLEYVDKLPQGTKVFTTGKGSMTCSTFVKWLEHFSRYKPAEKILLIFDGATPYLDANIAATTDEHNITLLCLPSNSTHELQSMNKVLFRSFEYHWDNELHLFWEKTSGRNLNRPILGTVFFTCWPNALSLLNIISGFRATKIFPYIPDIIQEVAFTPSTLKKVHQKYSSPGPSDTQQKQHRQPSKNASRVDSSDDDSHRRRLHLSIRRHGEAAANNSALKSCNCMDDETMLTSCKTKLKSPKDKDTVSQTGLRFLKIYDAPLDVTHKYSSKNRNRETPELLTHRISAREGGCRVAVRHYITGAAGSLVHFPPHTPNPQPALPETRNPINNSNKRYYDKKLKSIGLPNWIVNNYIGFGVSLDTPNLYNNLRYLEEVRGETTEAAGLACDVTAPQHHQPTAVVPETPYTSY
ncbi:hypothetical protein PR048_021418 [Dryococelus australis]|uniref:DDE-1 domain-containing protein n=1 Tax=Dryococelus australis TaxID=614101 RepID=A0ABQ9GYC0_9NEOP|nr:hypothetical protein PR048_021418 [Dryococelus australis]